MIASADWERGATCTLRYAGSATFVSFPDGPLPIDPIGIWIDVPMLLQVDVGVVSGERTTLVPVPPFFPRGLPATFQGLLLDGGALIVSTPATTILS